MCSLTSDISLWDPRTACIEHSTQSLQIHPVYSAVISIISRRVILVNKAGKTAIEILQFHKTVRGPALCTIYTT